MKAPERHPEGFRVHCAIIPRAPCLSLPPVLWSQSMSGLMSCEAIAGLIRSGRLPWRPDGYECITREQSDVTNPDRATAQTIRRMAVLTSESIATPRLQKFARKSAVTWRGGPAYRGRAVDWDDQRQLAASVWYGVNSSMKFVEHSQQIRALLNETDQLQLLISPDVLVRKRRPAGDCAIYTQLVCAALGTLGVHYEFVTLACDPREPDLYTHVYARAVLADGSSIPLDASHGKYPGWEVPREHQIRKQVWDEAGEPVEDRAPRPFAPLGQYRQVRRVMPRRLVGLRPPGLGQVDTTTLNYPGMPTDTGSVTVLNYPGMPTDTGSVTTLNYPGVPGTAAPGPSFNWDAWLGNFLNQGVKLAGQVVAPQTTLIRGPGGQLYYQAPASSGAALPATSILATGTGGNWLLIGGAVVAAILLLSSMGKR